VPFGPFRLHSYSCSRQRFFGLPTVLFPCGLQWCDFKGIRCCGILCRCKSQFLLYSSILSSMHSVCSSRRMESLVLLSLTGWPAKGLNSFISAASILRHCEAVKVQFYDPYKNVGKTKVLYNFKIVSVLTFLKIVLLIVLINCRNFASLSSIVGNLLTVYASN
jgi:hypothetical protein